MDFWVIKDGELVPTEPHSRPMRSWMLSEALLGREHSVTWWASSFSHHRKKLLYEKDTTIRVEPRFDLRLLYAGEYHSHVSPARYRHHVRLAKSFRRQAEMLPAPDLIVCAFPIIQLAFEAVSYAKARSIPIVVDVRDLWPDTIVNIAPRILRPIARALLASNYRMTRELLREADSLVAISEDSLSWALGHAQRERRPSDRVFPIGYPRGVREDRAQSPRIADLQTTAAGKTIFSFAGSIGRAWDVEFLCKAAAALDQRADARNIHFVLAGNGPGAKDVERRARKLGNVSWLGWLNRDEMSDLLALADVGLAPHRMPTEALPNKVFEYMTSGLPILSSLHGEAQRLIEDAGAGRSYPVGDLEKFIELALTFAEDSERRDEMGANGRALYDKICGPDVSYDAYAEYLESVAKGTPIESGVAHATRRW